MPVTFADIGEANIRPGDKVVFVATETAEDLGIRLEGTYLGMAQVYNYYGDPKVTVHLKGVRRTTTGPCSSVRTVLKDYVVNYCVAHFDYVIKSEEESEVPNKDNKDQAIWRVIPRNGYNAVQRAYPNNVLVGNPIILNAKISVKDAQIIADALNAEHESAKSS